MSLRTATLCFLSLTFSIPVFSWELIGHRIVGQIAQNHLSPRAAEQVKGLLGEILARNLFKNGSKKATYDYQKS